MRTGKVINAAEAHAEGESGRGDTCYIGWKINRTTELFSSQSLGSIERIPLFHRRGLTINI